jgi:hypothetical protein
VKAFYKLRASISVEDIEAFFLVTGYKGIHPLAPSFVKEGVGCFKLADARFTLAVACFTLADASFTVAGARFILP